MWHAALSPEQVQVGGRDPLTSFFPTPDKRRVLPLEILRGACPENYVCAK